MVVYALDGRKGDGAILSKDKAVRGRGVEPLDYGSASGEDLLYQSSDSLSENGFKESALRVVSYFKVSNPSNRSVGWPGQGGHSGTVTDVRFTGFTHRSHDFFDSIVGL